MLIYHTEKYIIDALEAGEEHTINMLGLDRDIEIGDTLLFLKPKETPSENRSGVVVKVTDISDCSTLNDDRTMKCHAIVSCTTAKNSESDFLNLMGSRVV